MTMRNARAASFPRRCDHILTVSLCTINRVLKIQQNPWWLHRYPVCIKSYLKLAPTSSIDPINLPDFENWRLSEHASISQAFVIFISISVDSLRLPFASYFGSFSRFSPPFASWAWKWISCSGLTFWIYFPSSVSSPSWCWFASLIFFLFYLNLRFLL